MNARPGPLTPGNNLEHLTKIDRISMNTTTNTFKRIAINTGGGDAPGLNAVIHAAVHAAHNHGWEVHGIRDVQWIARSPKLSRWRRDKADAPGRSRYRAPRRHDPWHEQSRQSIQATRAAACNTPSSSWSILPNSEVVTLPDISHGLHLENPQQFNQTVLELLSRH